MSVPGYNLAEELAAGNRRLYPAAYTQFGTRPAPAPMAAPTAMPTATGNVPGMGVLRPEFLPQQGGASIGQQSGPPKYSDVVAQFEQRKGGRLDELELENIRGQYKQNVLIPTNINAGLKDYQIKYAVEGFDVNAADFNQRYLDGTLGGGAPAAAPGSGELGQWGIGRGVEVLKDTAASAAVAATLGLGEGIANVGDYVARGIRGLYGLATTDKSELNGRNLTEVIADNVGDRTYLGDAADVLNQWGAGARQALLSDESLAASAQLNALIDSDAPASDIVAFIGQNPAALANIGGDVVGSIAGGRIALKLAKTDKVLDLLPPKVKARVVAAAIGVPMAGSSVADRERNLRAVPLDTLLQDPNNRLLYEAFGAMGKTGREQETAFRNRIVNPQLPALAGAAGTANVVLPGVFPGVESFGLLSRGMGRGAAAVRSALGEIAEELPATAIENIAGNIAQANVTGQNISPTKGLPGELALTTLLAGGLGGAAGAAMPNRNPLVKPPVAPTTPSPTPTAGTAAPTPGAVPSAPAPAAGPVAPGPGITPKAATTIGKRIDDDVSALFATRGAKAAATKLNVEGILNQAMLIAETTAGDDWATMSQIQRIEATELAAAAINKVAKNAEVAPALAALRAKMQPVAPAATVEEVPLPPEVTAPAPAPTNKLKNTKPATAAAPAATPAAVEPTPAPVEATPTVPAPPEAGIIPAATVAQLKLPAALSKSAPRFGTYKIAFGSDADLALYTVAKKNPDPKKDAPFLEWIKQNLGYDEAQARAEGARVSATLKAIASGNPPGDTLILRAGNLPAPFVAAPAPAAVVPAPPAPPATAPVAAPAPTTAPRLRRPPAPPAAPPAPAPAAAKANPLKGKATKKAAKTVALTKAQKAKAEAEAEAIAKAQALAEAETVAKAAEAELAKRKKAEAAAKKAAKAAGVPNSPKTNAPATGTGAAKAATKTDVAKALPVKTQVDLLLENELSEDDRERIVRAIVTANPGDVGPLTALITELRDNDGATITPAVVKSLRALIPLPKPKTAKQLEVETVSIQDARTPTMEGVAESQRVRDVLEDVVNKQAPAGKSKVGEALRQLANSDLTTTPQKWLALRIAPIVDKLGYTLELKNLYTAYGDHNSKLRRIRISTARASTLIHEAVHAVTVDAMKGDTVGSREIAKKWDDMYLHVKKWSKSNRIDWSAVPDVYQREAEDRWESALKNKVELATYATTDPYVRQVFSQIPAMNPKKANNFWDEFIQMLVDHWQDFTGADLSQRSYLQEIIELTAETVRFTEANIDATLKVYGTQAQPDSVSSLDEEADTVADARNAEEPPVPPPGAPKNKIVKRTEKAVTRGQRLAELMMNASLGLEKSMQEVYATGKEIATDLNPYYAMRRYTSEIAENKKLDNLQTVEPIRIWLEKNWRRFGSGTDEQFTKDLDKFMQAYHVLNERNPSVWAETVELNAGMDLQRAKLIDRAYKGELTGKQLNDALLRLAGQHATMSLEAWSKTSKNAMDVESLRGTLKKLADKGFTPAALGELNTLVQGMRDRARQRMIESGIVSADDPFADRGWEWYVPLKGSLKVPLGAAEFDIDSKYGSVKAFRDSTLNTLEGRQSNAGNALSQLVEDMNNASTFAAERNFKETIYEYAQKFKDVVKPNVVKFTGTPKSGYTYLKKVVDEKTGKVKYVSTWRRNLKTPKSGFVFNDGNTHYVVYLPNNSQLNRGLVGLRSVLTPNRIVESDTFGPALQILGRGTNAVSRSMTTWAPHWQFTVGFFRDLSTLPTTVAATAFRWPWQAGPFAARYMGHLAANTAQLGNLPQSWNSIWGNKAALKAYEDANPNGFFGQQAAYRAAGGSTEFTQGFNRDRAKDELFGGLQPTVGGRAVDAYEKWNEVTGDWAALLENVGRVSAWQALVDGGMDPKEAAAITKGTLDYGQSGEWGRMINLAHAFFRVGATSIDTLRRAFTTKTGEYDYKKIATWMPVFGAMGAMAFQVMSMMLGDDEEGVPRISKISPETLVQRFAFPGSDGTVNSFPIGLGLPQLLLAPGLLGAMVSEGYISPEEAGTAYYNTIKRNAPVQALGVRKDKGIGGFVSSWITGLLTPTLGKPFVEVVNNTNAFGNAIHTDWATKDKDNADQGMPSTGQELKDIAKELRDITGGVIDMYPEEIAHYARGYGGQIVGETIRWTVDVERKEQEGLDAAPVRSALRTAVTDEDFYYRNETRAVKDELQIAKRQLNAAIGRGETEAAWLARNPDIRKRVEAWKELDKAQKAYYDEIAAIRDDKLMSPERRRLRRKRADSTLRQAVERAQRVLDAT